MPTRFAPSPTGLLHLGHAFSAITAWNISQKTDKKFILRIEDIDLQRCKVEYEKQIFDDLQWLGLTWEKPVIRQKNRFNFYQKAIDILNNKNLNISSKINAKQISSFRDLINLSLNIKINEGLVDINQTKFELKNYADFKIFFFNNINFSTF